MQVSGLLDQLNRLRELFGDAEVKATTDNGATSLDVTGLGFTLTDGAENPSALLLHVSSPAPVSAPEAPSPAPTPGTPGGTP